jgi:glycosyltransferase involved in cell wall biosynthesis
LTSKNITPKAKSILWINNTLLDISINKGASLSILEEFSNLGYRASLTSARTTNSFQTNKIKGKVILIPLKRIPLILPLMFGIINFFLIPLYILKNSPNYVIMEPNVHVIFMLPSVIVAKLKKVKMVLDVRTVPVETIGFRGFMEKFWFFVSVVTAKRLFDGMTIITPLMKQEVCSKFSIDPTKVGVWTSGVSPTLFSSDSGELKSSELKKELGLSGKFIVFYHGIFTASRGLGETIEAVKLLKPIHPDIVFFLLGNGPIAGALKSQVQKDSLQENVIIHSQVEPSEVPRFINFSDVCIVPLPNNIYWRFQNPLKLLEYLAMKKVVILSDIPAHRLVAKNEECAIYLSTVTPTNIAKSIKYAYDNRSKLSGWGNIGRDIIENGYTWEKVARDLEAYLLSIDELKKK